MFATIKMLLKECLTLLLTLKELLKESLTLLRHGWKSLLRKLYGKLTGMTPESDPSLLEVLVTLKIVVARLPKKQRIAAYAGGVAAALVLVLVVGAAFTPSNGNSGSGGGGIIIGNHTFYQPEFSKLDCLTCRGDGDCNTCGGYGEVERYAGAGDTVTSKCSSCYGSGNCRTCGGSGKR